MDPEIKLRPYQIEDLSHLMNNWRTMLLHEPSCGKTPTVCVRLYQLWSEQNIRSVWTMPSSLMRKNKDELLRFTPFTDDQIVILGGVPKKKRKELIKRKEGVVFIHTFTGLPNDLCDLMHAHDDLKYAAVDEWHLGYKNIDSARTQALARFLEWREAGLVIMTGTIIDGGLASVYPAISFIEPRYYSGLKGFLWEHALYDYWGSIVGWKGEEKVQKILKRHGIRRTFEEVYGAESKQIHLEHLELDGQLKDLYDELESTALIELEDALAGHGLNTSAKLVRCRQLLAHPHSYPVTEADDTDYRDLMNGKLTQKEEALLIHASDFKAANEPFVVYGVFVPEIERLATLLHHKAGLRVGMIHGGVTAKTRNEIDKDFREGVLNCIVGSPQTAAVGFNWQHSGTREVKNVIFMSMDYNDSTFTQAYRRAIRDKRDVPLLIRVLTYKDTIERRVFEIVLQKSGLANSVDPSRQVFNFTEQ